MITDGRQNEWVQMLVDGSYVGDLKFSSGYFSLLKIGSKVLS